MRAVIAFCWLLMLLCGCAGHRAAEHLALYRNDSVRMSLAERDSSERRFFLRDSIRMRDSVFVLVRGDTVVKHVERERVVFRTLTDTLTRYRAVHDTLFVERRDSVAVDCAGNDGRREKRPWVLAAVVVVLCCVAVLMWRLFIYRHRKY